MITMQVEGTKELEKKLRRMSEVVLEVSQKNIIASCRRVVATAKSLAPVRTGALREAITYSTTTKTRGYVGIRAGSPAGVYWRFIEFGTIHYGAHPFFRPAGEAERGRFVDATGREMRSELEHL